MSGRYERHSLQGGLLTHHVGSSDSKAGYSWIEILRKKYPETRSFTCAVHGCRAEGVLGAHVRAGRLNEFGKLFGCGGTPVVPCCKAHHNTRGGQIRIKATPAVVDMNAPLDLF